MQEARPNREFRSVADTIIMNAETRVCRATKRSFVEEVSFQRPLRLRGGSDREPRRSISGVLEQSNQRIIDASLEVIDSESVNLQVIIDFDLDGNINFIAENPLGDEIPEDLEATIVAKETQSGFQTQIEFNKAGSFRVDSIEIEPQSNDSPKIDSGIF